MKRLFVPCVVLALMLGPGATLAAEEASPAPDALASTEDQQETAPAAKCFGRSPTIVALAGVETMGTPEADVILGTVGDDVIRGEGGNDRICAGDGADVVEGGDGKDRIDGGGGPDRLDGGAGNDTISGGKGADEILGGAGNDTLSGGGSVDTLDGGKGQDRCDGGAGHDWLPGCNDRFRTKGRLTIRKNTTLKGPHKGNIVFGTNKVTLDCAGHTVTGPGAGVGIWLAEDWRSGQYGQVGRRTGITVKNCDVTRFTYGILLSLADRNTLTRNRAHGNSRNGITLEESSNNKLTWNIADDNGFGSGPTFGFQLAGNSHRNVLKHNSASGSHTNFSVEDSSRNTLEVNTASGGQQGFNIMGNRNSLVGNTVTEARTHGFGTAQGFGQHEGNNNVFTDNTQTGSSEVGFRMGGFGNTITGNAADDNRLVGIEDYSVPGANSYADNTCIGNGGGGSSPEGLCGESIPPEPAPSPQPSDSPDPTGPASP